jgi:hypothetical protein
VDDQPDALQTRYGHGPSPARRRAKQVGLGALVVATLAVVTWLGYGVLRDPVQWKPVGYSVKGPDRIDVTFDITKAPEATVRCTIVALSSTFAEVGVREVTVGPTEHATERFTESVATQELAVTGEVHLCDVVSGG